MRTRVLLVSGEEFKKALRATQRACYFARGNARSVETVCFQSTRSQQARHQAQGKTKGYMDCKAIASFLLVSFIGAVPVAAWLRHGKLHWTRLNLNNRVV